MESHNTSLPKNGFTILEILIVLGILAIVSTFGLFISLDFYRSYSFRSERAIVLSTLQKARSQSIHNINQKRHGVHFQASPMKYILFECTGCTSYPGSASSDQAIDASYNIAITTPSLPFDVVFDQLSGDCISPNCATVGSPLAITLSAEGKTHNLDINSEGRINW